jgi:hypothetical protein
MMHFVSLAPVLRFILEPAPVVSPTYLV